MHLHLKLFLHNYRIIMNIISYTRLVRPNIFLGMKERGKRQSKPYKELLYF